MFILLLILYLKTVNTPLAIIDYRLPVEVKENLRKVADVIELSALPGVYDAISSHPDIFFCKMDEILIVAPLVSDELFQKFCENNVRVERGNKNPNITYPASARYNCVITSNLLIHCLNITDEMILLQAKHKRFIHVKQGYTRCNIIPLGDKNFITSDKGIQRTLQQNGLNVFYFDPRGIFLQGMKHGFIGGCAGILGKEVFFTGNIMLYPEGEKMNQFILYSGYRSHCLASGPLWDGGSIIFLNKT